MCPMKCKVQEVTGFITEWSQKVKFTYTVSMSYIKMNGVVTSLIKHYNNDM